MTDNGVTVTLPQMYAEIQAICGEVREMRAEVRKTLDSIEDHESRIRELETSAHTLPHLRDTVYHRHEERLRALERKVIAATGAAAVSGALAAAMLSEGIRALMGG